MLDELEKMLKEEPKLNGNYDYPYMSSKFVLERFLGGADLETDHLITEIAGGNCTSTSVSVDETIKFSMESLNEAIEKIKLINTPEKHSIGFSNPDFFKNTLVGVDFAQAGGDYSYSTWWTPAGIMRSDRERIVELKDEIKSLRETNEEYMELISWQVMEIDRLKAKLDDYEEDRKSPCIVDGYNPYDPLSLTEDFIFARDGSIPRGSLVETLPTLEDLELADLEYFRQRLYAGLRVPEQMQKAQQQYDAIVDAYVTANGLDVPLSFTVTKEIAEQLDLDFNIEGGKTLPESMGVALEKWHANAVNTDAYNKAMGILE